MAYADAPAEVAAEDVLDVCFKYKLEKYKGNTGIRRAHSNGKSDATLRRQAFSLRHTLCKWPTEEIIKMAEAVRDELTSKAQQDKSFSLHHEQETITIELMQKYKCFEDCRGHHDW